MRLRLVLAIDGSLRDDDDGPVGMLDEGVRDAAQDRPEAPEAA
jgi:hypothetical protein